MTLRERYRAKTVNDCVAAHDVVEQTQRMGKKWTGTSWLEVSGSLSWRKHAATCRTRDLERRRQMSQQNNNAEGRQRKVEWSEAKCHGPDRS